MELVSVIICTYNRAPLLADTLATLYQAVLAYGRPVEVLVVNNASTDHTELMVRAFAAAHPDLTLSLVQESSPGLCHARNTGMTQTRGDLVCFLDDDVFVPVNWLQGMVNALALAPRIGAIAGRIHLSFPDGTVPAWIQPKYYGFFSQYDQGETARVLPHGEGFYGANFALTRPALAQVGQFNPNLGRVGKNLLSGEETEYAERLYQHDFLVAYAPEGDVRHRVDPERLTFRWLFRRYFWQGVTVSYYPRNQSFWYPLHWLPKLLTNSLALPFVCLLGSRKRIYLTLFRIANALGPFFGWYTQRVQE